MKGAIIAAGEGDRQAARRAQEIGALLLQHKTETAGRHDRRPPGPEPDHTTPTRDGQRIAQVAK